GDGSDTIEGQDGTDTMVFNGANASEQVDLSANGNRLNFFRTQGRITMDTAGVERVDFNALGGADLVTVNDLSGTDVVGVNVDLAGTGRGANGDGQEDSVVVNGTDGSDTIEGQDGADTMLFNGADASEKIELSANSNRLRFTRDVAGITMDTNGVERVDFNALGGADLVTVNDLSGTDVVGVNVDLA